jgi:Ca-activated chloride channel family protein
MTFARPEMLWLLAAVAPLLTWFLFWAWRKRQALIRRFVQERLLGRLTVGLAPGRQKLRLVLLGLAALLILLALARPQYGYGWEEVRQRGLDIVMAIDTSRSMLAADVSPDRLTRAKLAARELQRLARADRLALVAFAGTAFLQCPLTLDDNAFEQSLNLLTPDLLPEGGTALGPAILEALNAFKDSGRNHRVIVLFSDGEDHEGDALAAAARAAEEGVKIFTVGVGTATGDRLRQVDEQGRTTYVLDEQNQPVISRLNAELLRDIARKTGGDYLPLIGADPMKTLYEARLAPLPRSDLSARWSRQYHERFQWPLGLAFLLLVIEMILVPRRRDAPPVQTAGPAAVPPVAAARRPRPTAVTALLLLALWPAPARADRALRDYERGLYRAAEQEYQRRLKDRPDDARLHYNAGTAAYAAGEYARATNHLEAATRTNDPELLQRVYYNLGNALYRLGEQAPAPPLTLTNWQQALQHYDSALQLNPDDADARFNRELVQARLEELQRQLAQQPQPQSQPPPSAAPQDQPQSDRSQPGSGQSESQNQPAPRPPPQPDKPPAQPQPPEPAPQPNKPSSAPRDTPSPQPQPQPEPQPGQAGAEPRPEKQDGQAGEKPAAANAPAKADTPGNETGAGVASAVVPGQMTPEQARQLLEAARLDEKAWQPLPPRDPRRLNRPRRDW